MKKKGKNKKNWVVRNKVYFNLVFTAVLTGSTAFSLWDNHFIQKRLIEISEIPYKPDFRVKNLHTDTVNREGKKEKLFIVQIINEGYKVEINHISTNPFLKIFRIDTTKIIPIAEGYYGYDSDLRTGVIRSYRMRDIFEIFKQNKERTVKKIEGLFSEDQPIYGAEIKYIAKISFKDYLSNESKEVFFEIDAHSCNQITSEEAERYFVASKRTRGAFSIKELSGDFLGQLMLN